MRRIAAVLASVLAVGACMNGALAQDEGATRNASRKGIAAGDLRSDILTVQKSSQRFDAPDKRVTSQGSTDQSSRVMMQESGALKGQADSKREIQGIAKTQQSNSTFDDVLRSGTKVDVNNFR